jgi:hypothetical protein
VVHKTQLKMVLMKELNVIYAIPVADVLHHEKP